MAAAASPYAPVDTAPTPDLLDLYRDYDRIYFMSRLCQHGVFVHWSSARMTTCAGLCRYRGALSGVEIVLSQPILQYRTATELKETLLHEMIHALLFVLKNSDNHEEHGPEFHRKMGELNRSAAVDPHRPPEGYHITVYHTFIDEVDHLRGHHWQCDKCKDLIKRPMNRPPSEKDCRAYRKDGSGWKHASNSPVNRCGDKTCFVHRHMRECGGTYIKIKEPPPRKKALKEKKRPRPADQLGKGQRSILGFVSRSPGKRRRVPAVGGDDKGSAADSPGAALSSAVAAEAEPVEQAASSSTAGQGGGTDGTGPLVAGAADTADGDDDVILLSSSPEGGGSAQAEEEGDVVLMLDDLDSYGGSASSAATGSGAGPTLPASGALGAAAERTLLEMGFDARLVRFALSQVDSIEQALELLN